MRFDFFVKQHAILHKIGKEIVKNTDHKLNFYNLPPKEFERKVGAQKKLINEYIERSENLTKTWKKNKNGIYDYLFNIHR